MKFFIAAAAMMMILLSIAGCTTGNVIKEENEKQEENTMAEETRSTTVTIETNKGTIKAELYDEKAPVTVKNFIGLARSGFYDGLSWHRYVRGFVIQGGDPNGDGTGGSKNTIPLEIHPDLKHIKGALGMARSQDPDSASSQFYITLESTPNLDGGYAVFGHVTEGMDIVLQLREGDSIEKVVVEG